MAFNHPSSTATNIKRFVTSTGEVIEYTSGYLTNDGGYFRPSMGEVPPAPKVELPEAQKKFEVEVTSLQAEAMRISNEAIKIQETLSMLGDESNKHYIDYLKFLQEALNDILNYETYKAKGF